jgi:hypothetical protein
MKYIVFNILFANLLAIGTIKTKAETPPNAIGDTVVVKLKNKNKILVITNESRNLKSFRTVNLNQIIADIDSTFRRDSLLTSGGEMEINLFQKDSTLRIKILSERDNIRNSYKAIIALRDGNTDTIYRDIKMYTSNNNSYKRRRNKIDDLFEIDLGWNNFLENGQLPSDDNKSYGLSPVFSNVFTIRGLKRLYFSKTDKRFSTSLGLEVSWNNYKFDNDVVITKNAESVSFEPFPSGQKKIKSKLTVSWLNVPLMFHYSAKHSSFHLAAGGFAGYRLGSHSKTKYSVDGSEKKDHVYTNFFLNSFQYGGRVQVGFYDVDFFVQYNLNQLFTKNKGPALTPFSFGFTL